ncbi:unnamed protein product [Vitrella brassicaformis CCMP3155]|uniref:F-box/LRR-repeat protein 15-like leucin rich repeat domain-containing protein n=1 Tax=Vitrella brassicaformis (strain CCMP3155) TaxID=1169540 RepID=A0A0G4FL20_VITBC|nr:unnamed protein product [Vitrella brassicaformis CCMP3155]|eukprot:CEM14674.1 unnamed protein product [Vitrella brassicaformis CCMP3155]
MSVVEKLSEQLTDLLEAFSPSQEFEESESEEPGAETSTTHIPIRPAGGGEPPSISDDVIVALCRFLPLLDFLRAVAVSRRFYHLGQSPCLWRLLDLTSINTCPRCLIRFMKTHPLVKELVAPFNGEQCGPMKMLWKAAPQLTRLDLSFLSCLNDASLQSIGRHLKNLEDLCLEGCERITDRGIKELVDLPLKRLNLAHAEMVLGSCLHRFEHLEELNVDGCFHLPPHQIVEIALNRGHGLKSLQIDGEGINGPTGTVLLSCLDLHTFSVSFAQELFPPFVRPSEAVKNRGSDAAGELARMKDLTCLRVRKGSNLSDDDVRRIFGVPRPSLHELVLAECHQLYDGSPIALSCRGLVVLDLSWCWHLSNEDVFNIAQANPKLQTVTLTGLKYLNDSGLLGLPLFCPQLTRLDLTQCDQVPDAFIALLSILYNDATLRIIPQPIHAPMPTALPPRVATTTTSCSGKEGVAGLDEQPSGPGGRTRGWRVATSNDPGTLQYLKEVLPKLDALQQHSPTTQVAFPQPSCACASMDEPLSSSSSASASAPRSVVPHGWAGLAGGAPPLPPLCTLAPFVREHLMEIQTPQPQQHDKGEGGGAESTNNDETSAAGDGDNDKDNGNDNKEGGEATPDNESSFLSICERIATSVYRRRASALPRLLIKNFYNEEEDAWVIEPPIIRRCLMRLEHMG